MTRSASDRMLDMYGFPGPVTPQVPQDRVRQTYRGLPGGAPGPFGCGDCKLPPTNMGALPAGAFMGAIGIMLAGTKKYQTPGTLTPDIAAAAGLAKGGFHHHGGHHHHGGGRGGAWWGYPGWDGGDTYIVNEAPCPAGYAWDPVGLRCVKIPTVLLKGLGSTATDWCTALRTGAAVAGHDADPTTTPPTPATGLFLVCNQITDPTAKAICKATAQAAQVGIATGCAHVDDPSGGTAPSIDTMKQAQSFAAAMNHVASNPAYFQPPASQSFLNTTGGKVAVGVGAAAVVGLLALAILRR